jgi:lipoprotein NlpI
MTKSMRLWVVCALLVVGLANVAAAGDEKAREAARALASGDAAAAERMAEKVLAEEPKNGAALMVRGMARAQRGRWETAEADFTRAVEIDAGRVGAYQQRGIARFMQGKATEAVADFDRYLELRPEERANHWQRGIALYYAGRFEDGAKQFELHRTVNPDDVENAAWHFLCVARGQGVEKARAGLIPVTAGADTRVPMAKIHDLFAGKAGAEDVIAAAKANGAQGESLKRQLFYAHLYVGLYNEALGKAGEAKEHLTMAVQKYDVGDYMCGVAKVHVKLLEKK